jgi:hypothetical protein
MTRASLVIATCLLTLAAGCGGDKKGKSTPPKELHPWGEEARTLFPRVIDLQKSFFSGTCSPNPNVCHQTNSYPDLHTVGNVLATVDAPCNVELPDPEQGWDSCELPADRLRAGLYTTDIAWITQTGSGRWQVGLRVPPDVTQELPAQIVSQTGDPVIQAPQDWEFVAVLVDGQDYADLEVRTPDEFVVNFVDSILATVVAGDPNHNGTWGGTDSGTSYGALVVPGNLEESYLWGRTTGTVPGTRMPLANGPVSNPEYVALACWILGLSPDEPAHATDPIDYDNCDFAVNPVDYEIQDY